MERREKEAFVAELRSAITQAGVVVVSRQTGLTVDQSLALRRQMREAGATFKVAKNTLARLAVEGTQYASLADHLKGPTTIAYSADPIAAAKVAVKFADINKKFEVMCGVMDGNFLSAAQVKALAELPSLDELRGKIIGLIQAPLGNVARVLAAPASQVARVLSAYSEK